MQVDLYSISICTHLLLYDLFQLFSLLRGVSLEPLTKRLWLYNRSHHVCPSALVASLLVYTDQLLFMLASSYPERVIVRIKFNF